MPEDFVAPPWGWSFLSIFGGLATAALLIIGLESLSKHLDKNTTQYSSEPSATEMLAQQAL